MAKKKTVEAIADDLVPMGVVVAEETKTEMAEEPEAENGENKEEAIEEAPKAVSEELPEYAKKALKVFKNMPELYVSPTGGVFTPDTKPSVYGNAILYKNPFYNS